MKRAFRELAALFSGIIVFALLFGLCSVGGAMLWPLERGTLFIAISTVVLVYSGTIFAFIALRRRLSLPPISPRVKAGLFILLCITWVAGVPQVHTDLASDEIATYKKLKSEDNRVWEAHPYIRFFVSVPIAPGLILTYHEYQLAGLYGAGGWEIHVWYGTGTRRVFGFPVWVS